MKKSSLLAGLLPILTFLLTACGQSLPQPTFVPTFGPTVELPEMTTLPGVTATQTLDNDFSSLTYTQAFDEMFSIVRRDYAFNSVAGKQPAWDALYADIRPRIQRAEATHDAQAYFLALRDFTLAFKDGHVNLGGGALQVSLFQAAIEGGYGFSIRVLDDGRVLVPYVKSGGPAAGAGIQVGAQVIEFNNQPISAAIDAVSIWGAPPSTESLMRYQKSRYLLRAPVGTEAAVTYANPGSEARRVTLTTIKENESFAVTSVFLNYNSQSLPVESKILSSRIGYTRVSSTSDNREELENLFESALKDFQTAGVSNLIIDLRVVVNLSSDPILPVIGLAGFLTDQDIPLGQFEYFNEATGQFEAQGDLQTIQPRSSLYRFSKLILLIGPGCSNACELEAYGLSKIPGLIVVGQTPSAGVLSDIGSGQFLLPEGFSLQIPTGRFVLPNGEILLEGQGLPLIARVPIDETTALSNEDVVLNTAEVIATGQ